MKKFYTLLACALCGATSVFAQSDLIFVNAAGEEIQDGATIVMDELVSDDFFGDYVELKGVSVKNTTDDDIDVTMNAEITSIPFGTFQCCLGTACRSKSNVGTITIKNVTIEAGKTLAITSTEWAIDKTQYGTCEVTFQLGDAMSVDGPKLNVKFVNADPSPVKAVINGQNNTVVARYTIDGKQLSRAQKGVNLVRYADGRMAKVVVK